MKRLDRSKLEVLVPGLKPGWEQGALEPSCSDIDVGGLHAAYLKAARAKGVRIIANARVERAKWADRHWQLEKRGGVVVAGVVVNAPGARGPDKRTTRAVGKGWVRMCETRGG